MPTNLLTAADLDAIEARWNAVGRRVPGGPDPAYEAMPDPRPDLAALLFAVREARALVAAMLDAGDWYHGHGDHLEGYIDVCYLCGVADGHDPVCQVGRAEDAIARWKGGE